MKFEFQKFFWPSTTPDSVLHENIVPLKKDVQHISQYRFSESIRHLIHQLKYEEALWVAKRLQKYYFSNQDLSGLDVDCVVAIPLHVKRLRERGYNQSLVLAKAWARKLKIPLLKSCLIRQKNTESQTGFSQEERKRNLKNAFVVSEKYFEKISDKKILLVDDVRTTGMTLNEAMKVLKEAGAKSVITVTLAQVSKKI